MAVESRFVVIRQGVEVQTFMDKKSADEYDKMLDIADSLSEMFERSPLPLNEQLTEDLSIYLAQNKDDLLVALQVKKAKPAKPVKVKKEIESVDVPAVSPEPIEVNEPNEPEAEKTETPETAKPKTRTRKKAASA